MFKTLQNIFQAIEFMRLPKKNRQVVFYSEGKTYWPIFKGLVDGVLDQSKLNVCYITSGKDDPGFKYNNKNFKSFLTDNGYVRNWLFENLQADILIMTMPDLNQYQVKRSKYQVHYIYVQHALVSLHMAYREGAFDFFDTIFCSGPHHIQEVRHIEEKYNLPQKKLLEHGYVRFDSIVKNKHRENTNDNYKHALFAPSWGHNATIELGLGNLVVEKLLSFGCMVTFRPHPETLKSSSKIIQKIIMKHHKNKMFIYDECISSLDSFYQSDFMVSDWSGAAIEYSLGLKKPVVFIDVPKKINNPKYNEIDLTPLEVLIRNDIGTIIGADKLSSSLINSLTYNEIDPNKYIFNIGKSDYYGVKYILDMIEN